MPERHVPPTPHDAMLTRWRSRVASRLASPTTSTLDIPTAPIPPAPPTVVAPSTDTISPVDAPPGLYDIARPITVIGLPHLSTMYPPMTSESSARDSSSESSTRPSRKRCRSPTPTGFYFTEDSVEEDIDTNVLADIKADATAVEVAVDRDVKAGVDASIGMEVDVGIDVEDEVKDERLEQVEEVVQDIYGHVMEIPLQRVEDIETRQRELKVRSLIAGGERASLHEQVASLERSNARLRGTMMMESARADMFWQCMSFMESDLRQICRFRYYDKMRFRRLEAFAVRRLGFRP
ncbi:hypothetical protein Tco_0084985 [Tanacetum coccineum]